MEKKKNQVKKTNKQRTEVRIFALGGLGAVGMNMYVVECNDEIIVMDAGVLFANDEALGVDYIIPDFTYLKENESRIVGLFITHGHEDHIGSLPFLLEKVNIPVIYASGLAIALINNKMAEFPNTRYNLLPYDNRTQLQYKHCSVSFFRTNHSIPDSHGIAVKTDLGYVVNTGDFKFDFTPVGAHSDYYKMAKLGEDGVLCLLADSTNASIKNFSPSERKVAQTLKNLFGKIEGRIIVATFASNVYRVQQIIEASVADGRKVAVFGHSMDKNIEAAIKHKFINVPRETFIPTRELNKHTHDKITILCTGSQGEPLAALSRIAKGTHKQLKLLPNDTVIYSSKPIPGNEQFINRNINRLIKAGANVIKNSPLTDTHTTGHASAEEIKMMLAMMKPKYFMPVHGEYNMLKQHALIAMEMGFKKDQCFCLNAGDVLHFNNKGIPKVIENGVFASDMYLNRNLSDVASNILKERKRLADEGMITLVFTISNDQKIISPTQFVSKGFMNPAHTNEFSKEIINCAESILKPLLNGKKPFNTLNARTTLLLKLSNYIYEKTERRPFIVPLIMII